MNIFGLLTGAMPFTESGNAWSLKHNITAALQAAADPSDCCRYPDFTLTDSGLQYKDLRDGSGGVAKDGSHVTVDWDGYTLGYYGRPFEARNKVMHVSTCMSCLTTSRAST